MTPVWITRFAATLLIVSAAATVAPAEDPAIPDLRTALTLALQDEYHARDTYRAVLAKQGEVRPFTNVVAAEERHIAALIRQFERLGYAVPEPDARTPMAVPATRGEACVAAATAERANVALYDRLLAVVAADAEVEQTFRRLQEASRERHLPAFERCAQGGAGPPR